MSDGSYHPEIRSPGLESAWSDMHGDHAKEVVSVQQPGTQAYYPQPQHPYQYHHLPVHHAQQPLQQLEPERRRRLCCGCIPVLWCWVILILLLLVAIGLGVGLGVGLSISHE